MTGETKPVHQFGGSIFVTEGWATAEQERTAIERITAPTKCLGLIKARPRGLSEDLVNRMVTNASREGLRPTLCAKRGRKGLIG